jgi:hypothetical protein
MHKTARKHHDHVGFACRMVCCLFELVKFVQEKKLKDQRTLQSCGPKGNNLFSDCSGFLTTARQGLKEASALLCLVYHNM